MLALVIALTYGVKVKKSRGYFHSFLGLYYLCTSKFLGMYAVVDIAGDQLKVQKDSKVYVNRLNQEEGASVEFDQVLLVDDNGKVKVGTPNVKNAKVKAKVVEHLKADKKTIYKKKRRTGYQLKKGHRQPLTELQIEDIEK